jgi:hypothetical protein
VAIGGNADCSAINTGDRNILGDGFRVDGDYVAGDKTSHHQIQSSITDPEFFTSKTDHHEQPFDYEVSIGSQWGDLKIGAVSDLKYLKCFMCNAEGWSFTSILEAGVKTQIFSAQRTIASLLLARAPFARMLLTRSPLGRSEPAIAFTILKRMACLLCGFG